MKRIVVVGGAGYIGSHLVGLLLNQGHFVTVLDNGLFGFESIAPYKTNERFNVVNGDIRISADIIKSIRNAEVIIHLAGIVGNPACSYDRETALSVNVDSIDRILELAHRFKVKKFIFASSCSTYGYGTDIFDENSTLNPVDFYAETKVAGENKLVSYKDEIAVTILRYATLYGASRRMRFDLALNVMTANAVAKGQFSIYGGEQWRPFVHCLDAARATSMIVNSPLEVTDGEIFNVGSLAQNIKVSELGLAVKEVIENTEFNLDGNKEDNRSYRVSFEKIQKQIGFSVTRSITDGIKEIEFLLKTGIIPDYSLQSYSNLEIAKQLDGLMPV